jgi:hypothetical protein
MPLTMPAGTANAFRQRSADRRHRAARPADHRRHHLLLFRNRRRLPHARGRGRKCNLLFRGSKPSQTLERTRTLRSNLGTIALQNLSGNTIERDVASALITREFEGAFCILRFWEPGLAAALEEYSGFLRTSNRTRSAAASRSPR